MSLALLCTIFSAIRQSSASPKQLKPITKTPMNTLKYCYHSFPITKMVTILNICLMIHVTNVSQPHQVNLIPLFIISGIRYEYHTFPSPYDFSRNAGFPFTINFFPSKTISSLNTGSPE